MIRGAWVGFVSSRWFAASRKSGGSASSVLAASGIAIGVAALIVVLGVMNGFQLGFIDSILEIASFHVRVESGEPGAYDPALLARMRADPEVRSVLPFAEERCLMGSSDGRVQAILLRAVPRDTARQDPSLMPALGLDGPLFPDSGGLVLGVELARSLNVRPGQVVDIVAVTSSRAEGVQARTVSLPVARTFRSGYYEYDSGLAFIAQDEASPFFPVTDSTTYIYGIKLKNRYADAAFADRLRKVYGLPPASIESWRHYNRAFFGALRTEKSMMMLLIGLIFLVVGVNIFHAMRRAVAERIEDIAVLQALGARSDSIRRSFMLDALAIGAGGALVGLVVGLLIAVNVNEVFAAVEAVVNALGTLLSHLVGGGGEGDFRVFSPHYFYLMEVPVRVLFPETLFMVTAAIASAVVSARAASAPLVRLDPAEVLRYE